MFHGLPGTGKSFIAEELSKNIPNSVVLKTVNFRPVHGEGAELFDEDIAQTKADKDSSYLALRNQAKKAVLEGKTPILDATFHKGYRRTWVYNLAKEMNEKLILISLSCDENVVFERLKKREGVNDGDSFLNFKEAYNIMKKQADVFCQEASEIKYIDTTVNFDFGELQEWLKNFS